MASAKRSVDHKEGSSSAILLKLDDDVLQDIKKASKSSEGLRFTTGKSPALRIGSRTIDLNISSEEFRNELYYSTVGSATTDLKFANVISHQARAREPESKSKGSTAGAEDALATLQSSLAMAKQIKEANQTTITTSLLPEPKNRAEAAKQEKLNKKHLQPSSTNHSLNASPSLSAVATPRLGAAPTSAPANEQDMKLQAMKTPLIHLLAMQPAKTEDIVKRTHIPKDDLLEILQKAGKQVDGKWQLTDRACRELDVWKFEYPTKEDRQAAIDSAVKAFDRLRIGKEDKLWQMLLPKEDRGKGIVLSKLQLGGGRMGTGLTPAYQPSPMLQVAGGGDSRAPSAVNTPRLGASTPQSRGTKGDVVKRLLSKNPKKARAVEEAKEKKRKAREEAAASDREGARPAKRQATSKKVNANVKSAEFVHTSDEESEDEIAVKKPIDNKRKVISATKQPNSKAVETSSSESSDTPIKSKRDSQNTTSGKARTQASPPTATSPPAVKASKPTNAGSHHTPQKPQTNGLSVPNSQTKPPRSPPDPNSKPKVPSPLGAARPRVASDVSDRSAVGVQKVKHGADTPNGLGINGVLAEDRQHTTELSQSTAVPKAKEVVRETLSNAQSEDEEMAKRAKGRKAAPKRKATEAPAAQPEAKQRKKEESPIPDQSEVKQQKKEDSPVPDQIQPEPEPAETGILEPASPRPTLAPEIDAPFKNTRASNNENDDLELTWEQAVTTGEDFGKFYPAYDKMYDEQAAMEARGEKVSAEDRKRLLDMHARLAQMKREMYAADARLKGNGMENGLVNGET